MSPKSMVDTAFRYAFLVGLALTVLAVGYWLVRAATQQLLGASKQVVMPFQVIGKDDSNGKLGPALAQMLIARFARIEREMETSADALRVAKVAESAPGARTMDVTSRQQVTIPEQVFAPLEVKFSLGGVEVGSALSSFYRLFKEEHAYQVSVEYLKDRAIVAGVARGGRDRPVHIDVPSPENSDIVDAFAYSIMQRHMAARIPEVNALTPMEFRTLLTTLSETAEINVQAKLGAQVSRSYAGLLEKMEPLAQKMPRWQSLLRVVGQLAEASQKNDVAIAYYQREMALSADDARRAELQKAIEELQARERARATVAEKPGDMAVAVQKADPALRRLLSSPAAEVTLRLLGVSELTMAKDVTVAVMGGLPAADLPKQMYTVVGSPADAPKDRFLPGYVSSVVQWVRVVAPRAKFVFAPLRDDPPGSGMFSDAALLHHFEELLQTRPQIVLFTLGPLRGAVWEATLAKAADNGVLVVHAAGNEEKGPISLAGSPLLDRVIVTSAVDWMGNRAKFAPKSDKVLWAPGVDLPVIEGNEIELRSGTSYSAAVMAGIAARLYAERRIKSPEEMVSLLRKSGEAKGSKANSPPVVNLAAALINSRE